MNGRWRNGLSLGLMLLIFGGIGWYLRANAHLLAAVGRLTWWEWLLLIGLRVFFLLLNGWMLRLFVAQLGVRLRWWEWSGLAYVTTLGNYLTPFSGGMLARATYLKSRHNLPYAHFLTLLAASYVVTFGGAALLGLGCLLWLGRWTWQTAVVGLFLLAIMVAIAVLLVLPAERLPLPENRLGTAARQMLTGWQQIRQDGGLLGRLLLLMVVSAMVNGLAFWLGYRAVATAAVPVAGALLVSLTAVFAVLLTITPGNLGVREALIGVTSELVGIGVGEGLVVALLIRMGTLATVFTIGPLFAWILSRPDPHSASDGRNAGS